MNEKEEVKKSDFTSGLVIEENTIYEVDEECLECLKKERNKER